MQNQKQKENEELTLIGAGGMFIWDPLCTIGLVGLNIGSWQRWLTISHRLTRT